jgi:hypothetical protein
MAQSLTSQTTMPSVWMELELSHVVTTRESIGDCRELEPQKFFTTLQCTEDRACVMDDPTVPERVKHRLQVASESQYCRGAGVASCTVPADAKLDLTNNEAVFARRQSASG